MVFVIQSKRHTKATACHHFLVLTNSHPSSLRIRISCTFVVHTEPVIIYLWWEILWWTQCLPTFASLLISGVFIYLVVVFNIFFIFALWLILAPFHCPPPAAHSRHYGPLLISPLSISHAIYSRHFSLFPAMNRRLCVCRFTSRHSLLVQSYCTCCVPKS